MRDLTDVIGNALDIEGVFYTREQAYNMALRKIKSEISRLQSTYDEFCNFDEDMVKGLFAGREELDRIEKASNEKN